MSVRVALLLGLAACGSEDPGGDDPAVDRDGDGLTDDDERAAGLDPKAADTDADGLDDGAERDAGTDPLAPDTDGDGYRDGDEVAEGRDPTDAASRIYAGGWPYDPDKDALGDAPPTGVPVGVGEQFFRMDLGKDQFGDPFDLYDFAGGGRLVVLDASATWCTPCQQSSAWLARGPADDALGLEGDYAAVRAAVDGGSLAWITFLTDGSRGLVSRDEIRAWDEAFAHPAIPVVDDPTEDVKWAVNLDPATSYVNWPAFVVLDEDMRVVFRGGLEDTLAFVLSPP